MDSFLSLLRLALERGWALGALLAVFFGGILFGATRGVLVPAGLQEWSHAGVLFGVAILLVSLMSHAVRGIAWMASRSHNWWTEHKQLQSLRERVTKLSAEERAVLQTQIQKGEQTFYMNPFTSRSIPEHVRLMGLYRGLEDKGILELSPADPQGKVVTLHVTDEAWSLLVKSPIREKEKEGAKSETISACALDCAPFGCISMPKHDQESFP